MQVIENSKVIHAGTMNTNNPTVAAALTTIEVLESENPYDRMFNYGKQLIKGLNEAAKLSKQDLVVQGPGPMLNTAFTPLKKIKDYRDTLTFDKNKMKRFIAAMQDKGIRIIGRGLWYISAAHKEEDIEQAIRTATEVLKTI
jgi:glutamate-1-semialdehyde 2,1-aminomutase